MHSSDAPDWSINALRAAIACDLDDVSVEVLADIDSTNSELMRRARAGRLEPVVLVAERQRAGRGRLGREWFSGPGPDTGLTFSLGLPLTPLHWSGLSLVVGISIAQSLHPQLRLKWPNDVWWCRRKLAGVLVETTSIGDARYAVIGVGVNIRRPGTDDLSTPAAWLGEVRPDLSAALALMQIAGPLVRAVKAFEAHGFAPFQIQFNALDALAGQFIALSDGTTGVAEGVNGLGALRVQMANTTREIVSTEVSVRPQSDPSLATA